MWSTVCCIQLFRNIPWLFFNPRTFCGKEFNNSICQFVSFLCCQYHSLARAAQYLLLMFIRFRLSSEFSPSHQKLECHLVERIPPTRTEQPPARSLQKLQHVFFVPKCDTSKNFIIEFHPQIFELFRTRYIGAQKNCKHLVTFSVSIRGRNQSTR